MDSPKPPSPPHATDGTTTGRHSSATTSDPRVGRVKSLLLRCAINSTPTKSLTPQQKTLVEKRLDEIFPSVYTPDHPPYAWMIEEAIKELNEKRGSTEEAISSFILQKYKKLPFFHAGFLEHHLGKLCESGNLVESRTHRYLIVKPIIPNLPSKRHPSCTLSSIRTPSPCSSPSPSSNPTYASRSARGRGRGRGRGRRVRGPGRGGEPSSENMMIEVYADKVEDEVHVHQIQYLTGDDEMANESFQGKEQPQARGVDVENQAGESTMVIEIESPEQEYRFNEERTRPLQLVKVGKESNSPITEVCLINDDATAMEKSNQTRQSRPRPPKFQPDQTKGLEKNQETNQHSILRPRPLTTKPQLRKRSSKTQK